MAALSAGHPVGPPGAAGAARGVEAGALVVRAVDGRLARRRAVADVEGAGFDGGEAVRAGLLGSLVVRREGPAVGEGGRASRAAAGRVRGALARGRSTSRSTARALGAETDRVPSDDAVTVAPDGVQLRLTAAAARHARSVFAPTPAPFRCGAPLPAARSRCRGEVADLVPDARQRRAQAKPPAAVEHSTENGSVGGLRPPRRRVWAGAP